MKRETFGFCYKSNSPSITMSYYYRERKTKGSRYRMNSHICETQKLHGLKLHVSPDKLLKFNDILI